MDVRNLSFEDATFDVAIDKGKGLLLSVRKISKIAGQERWMQ